MRAGLEGGFAWAVYLMAVLLVVIFIGFVGHFRTMFYGRDAKSATPEGGQFSVWCSAPMWLALLPLLLFGLWWPAGLWSHLTSAAQSLSPGPP